MPGSPDTFARLNAMAVVGMSAAGKAMTDEQRAATVAAVTADSIDLLQPYIQGNELVFEIGTNVAVARVA